MRPSRFCLHGHMEPGSYPPHRSALGHFEREDQNGRQIRSGNGPANVLIRIGGLSPTITPSDLLGHQIEQKITHSDLPGH